MKESKMEEFLKVISGFNDYDYMLSMILCSIAPTIKKHKVSSLMTFCQNNKDFYRIWSMNKERVAADLNVSFYELKNDKKHSIVLFYNEDMLENTLQDKNNLDFLGRFGYSKEMSLTQILKHLSIRFEAICPHEIGIFLGYPIEDVKTFVDCPNAACKMTGYWKVYHDEESAKTIFNKYDSIKSQLIDNVIKNRSLNLAYN